MKFWTPKKKKRKKPKEKPKENPEKPNRPAKKIHQKSNCENDTLRLLAGCIRPVLKK